MYLNIILTSLNENPIELCLIHLCTPAPGLVSVAVEGLSECLLMERMPGAGHSDGINGGEGFSPTFKEFTM